ncbi:MFS transporter [Pseudomonas fontis]|uniref:MFS transporter n=1 Tax=Pseudomonas fontis TaxID=2942633 RepID=A0ABT5NN11_9PSED|nr:MFS transporter [Pseudomonas fontis]MDD0973315.1 MFS transporter [Pseudomonas fontis]MDD0989553.1 MFS transporter [Pseudomonas fontis]
MSKSATFERPRSFAAAAVIWQLTQVLWVGGLWILHFGLLPVLGKIGLAPLLIDDISNLVASLLVAFAAFGCGLQVLVLIQVQGLASLWRDMRGQLLLMAVLACAVYFLLRMSVVDQLRWQLFCYLVLGLTGLLLVLQPVPGRARRARH